MPRILVTGANGFVGRSLLPELTRHGHEVRPAVRRASGLEAELVVGDIGPRTDWAGALRGVDCVVHLAGRAHVLRDEAADPLAVYREVNTEGTRSLARAAHEAGVRRFVFVSSIKVNGEATNERPFTAADPPAPLDAYGMSKLEAEQALRAIAGASGLETCVIRPVLVYGPGAKGNFERLVRLIDSGWPLPFGAIANRRSLVSVFNLADLIVRCISHPAAAGGTFLVSDGEALSTAELIRRIAAALRRPPRLVPVPPAILRIVFAALGRSGEFTRLCGSLAVDIADTCRRLEWQPPVTVEEGLRRSVMP